MKHSQAHVGIGSRIAAGFMVVLVLMASLMVLGLRHISETNQRLKDIVEHNNVKTGLATAMQAALRERALSMHAMLVLTNPFDRDAEMRRFDAFGADYVIARQRLEQLPLGPQERAILDRIEALARRAQPEVQAVMEMAMAGKSAQVSSLVRNVAMPKQREMAEEVNELIRLQQQMTASAVKNAEASYNEVRDLMILLGLAAITMGLLISFYVIRRVGRQAKQLVTQALYDSLTGLPNRTLLMDRLEQAIALARRRNLSFGVALLDLDHFKVINDTLGHDVGDELLREIGQRLRKAVRAQDTVARMGGDEFVVILHGLSEASLARFAEKLLDALEKPFVWQGQGLDVGASVGFSLYPQHAEDPGSLIRYADIAMYAAKRTARGYTLYAPEHEQVGREALSLKSELREAIQANQLTLHYQPKVDHQSCRVVGLEALVRWNHPRLGLLPPGQFIPLAEEAGLIEPLTQWVLKTALAQLSALHARGYPLSMAVNLSARCLYVEELPAAIAKLLTETGAAAEYLTIEITESAIMSTSAEVLDILDKLDRMGITLAIDDFGTGYSSLAHLKQLPVDEIKIDKSFVIDMEENDNDAVIVRSTIDLGHNLGLRVVAEGVETEDEWITLCVLGCDHSQGFYLCKPLPADSLLDWLENSSATVYAALCPAAAAS